MSNDIKIGIAKLMETGSRYPSNFFQGPEAIEEGGLHDLIKEMGFQVVESCLADLTTEEKKEYGAWHKLGIASRHLANIVTNQKRNGLFPLGLLSNCNGLMGMLAGLQNSGSGNKPLKTGLIWIDAHGDFNTPETTLSGMLGGMPVAVSTGLCLHRLRLKCGLDPALPTSYVTMVGVRDTDPLEQELLDRSDVQHITVKHIRDLSPVIDLEMERLSILTDLTYVHIDLDVLDPKEVQGHSLTVPYGPTSQEMAEALEVMFEHPSAASFGIASYPAGQDPNGITMKAVFNLIRGVLRGLQNR